MRASLSLSATVLCVAAGIGCASPSGDPSGGGGNGNSAGTTGSAGTAGSSTTGTAGSTPAMCGPQTAPAAANGANFPFPQHKLSANCGYPTNCNDADVM